MAPSAHRFGPLVASLTCTACFVAACTAELRNTGATGSTDAADAVAADGADTAELEPDSVADVVDEADTARDRDASDAAEPEDLPAVDAASEQGELDPSVDASTPDLAEEPPPEPNDMVVIPGGPFWWGCNSTLHCYPDEEPYRQISVSTFELDRTEVTRSAFRECVDAGSCAAMAGDDLLDRPNYPVEGVTWEQARDYCAFRGKRLPTGAEWERAARGTQGGHYPWGEDAPTCEIVNALACNNEAMPVGSYPAGASAEGVLDLLGNVWEWTADWYSETYYADAPDQDPPGPESGPGRVYRGGAYPTEEDRLDTWLRYFPDGTPGDERRRGRTGVRCAR